MITGLLRIQFARIKRQKILYLYFAVMAVMFVSKALQCMKNPGEDAMGYYAGGRFPTFCMQTYIDIIGPLFLSFICAVLISGERVNGMLKQPLLSGASKKQLLTAKTVSILAVAGICFLFVVLSSAGIGFWFWGSHVFGYAREYLPQMLLLIVPQITMVLFMVFLSLHMSNIPSMMCASLIILLVNNLFSQFFGDYAAFVDFMYYLYAFSGYNGIELKSGSIVLGILVNLVTGIVLVCGIDRRIKNLL